MHITLQIRLHKIELKTVIKGKLCSSFFFIYKYSPNIAIARGIQDHFNISPQTAKNKKQVFLDTHGKSIFMLCHPHMCIVILAYIAYKDIQLTLNKNA